jgi:hypothetical protein
VIAAGLAAALMIGGIIALMRRRRGRTVPVRSAHEIALEALERLRAEGLLERQRYEDYYVRLSGIVRHYVEGRFGLRAPEMTTDEFLAAAQRSRELAGENRLALQEFLSEADLVKFARHVPSRDRAERAGRAAGEFIDATRPREEQRIAAA